MTRRSLQVTVVAAEHADDLPEVPNVWRFAPHQRSGRDVTTPINSLDDLWNGPDEQVIHWRERFLERLSNTAVDGLVSYIVCTHPLLGDLTVQHLVELDDAGELQLTLYNETLPDALTDALIYTAGSTSFVDVLELREIFAGEPYTGGSLPLHANQRVVITNVTTGQDWSCVERALRRRYSGDTPLVVMPMLEDEDRRETSLGDLAAEQRDYPAYVIVPQTTGDMFQRTPDELQRLVARLRAPGGCPWDRDQTHQSLVRNLIEESYEVLDAIESGSAVELREELGDFVLQAWLHCQIAEESGDFTLEDVLGTLAEKLVRRHPHVFASAQARDADAVVRTWDEIKQEERRNYAESDRQYPLGTVPTSLPALLRAQSVIKRARRTLTPAEDVRRLSHRALNDAGQDDNGRQLTEKLLHLIESAHEQGVDLEQSLRQWTRAFEREVAESQASGSAQYSE